SELGVQSFLELEQSGASAEGRVHPRRDGLEDRCEVAGVERLRERAAALEGRNRVLRVHLERREEQRERDEDECECEGSAARIPTEPGRGVTHGPAAG